MTSVSELFNQNNMGDGDDGQIRLLGTIDRTGTGDHRGGVMELPNILARAISQFTQQNSVLVALENIPSLEAIASSGIVNRQVQIVAIGTDGQPQTWVYDSSSAAPDSATVKVPTDNPATGRWVTRDHGSGSGTPAPTITGFVPPLGGPGTPIDVQGTALLGATVEFSALGGGRTTATVTNDQNTSQTVLVPANATTGPVWATTAGGEAQSPSNFIVGGPL